MGIDSSKIPGFEIGNEHEDDEGVSYFEYPKVNGNSGIKKTQQERLLEAFLDGKKPLSNISTIILYQYCILHNIAIPEGLEEKYQLAIQSDGVSTQGWIEKYLFSKIKEKFPDAESNIFIDGFEVDIFIPSLGVIVESDTPNKYPHRYPYLQKRDTHLLKKYGYTTTRFSSLYKQIAQTGNKSKKLKDDITKIVAFLLSIPPNN